MNRTPEQIVAFDVETTGLDPWKGDRIFSYSLTDWNGKTKVYRFDNKSKKENDKALKILQDFFNDTRIIKIAHNYKFDMSHVIAYGINIPEDTIWHDTMIMSQMLQNKCPRHSLDYLAELICGYPPSIDREIKAAARQAAKKWNSANPDKNHRDVAYEGVDSKLMHKYQVADGERCMLIYQNLIDKLLADNAMYKDYLNEIKLVDTTMRMERSGLNISVKATNKIVELCEATVTKAQNQLNKLVGYDINVNSSAQLSAFLYDKKKLRCTRFTDKNNPSTDKIALEELDAKYKLKELDLILKIRAYERGATTCRKYIELADDCGLIHPNIKTNEATTGRQSCADPNLQNIPKAENAKTRYPIPARKCFVAPEDYVLLLVDYSGIELRLIIDACKELEMIECINRGGDVHGLGAETVYQREYSKLERAGCKTLGFTYPYGGGDAAAAKDLINIDNKEIIAALKRYKKRFPKLVSFNYAAKKEALDKGFVETAFGRKITVSKNKIYTGANYKIQGTAAGVLKRGQNRIMDYTRYELDNPLLIQPIVPVHDELVIKYHRSILGDLEKHMEAMTELLCWHPEITVRLDAEWDISTTSWHKKKELSEFNKYLAKLPR